MTVYIGIDWSENKHDLCFLNQAGEVLLPLKIPNTPYGYAELEQARQRIGVAIAECVVGIETHHNLLLDYLVEQGYQPIYVLAPNAVKTAQGLYRQTGAKSDASDARLIAEMLRLDRHKYAIWTPDLPLTRQMRAVVSLMGHLNKEIYQTSNRLRAALLRYYPTALTLFSALDSPISLAWVLQYPTPEVGQALSYAEFQAFLRYHHHTCTRVWARIYARLQEHQASAAVDIAQVYAQEAQWLARLLQVMVQARHTFLEQLQAAFLQHPDCAIYQSLPGTGPYLQPALLAMLGDDRQRYATPAILQALAGTCPVTKQSGKTRYVVFRRACDRAFRQIVQQWARLSVTQSPWAAGYFSMVRPHCHSENEAYRKLANRWLEILWRLWQDHAPYEEQRHLSAHARRTLPRK